jgi:hypothetical protein
MRTTSVTIHNGSDCCCQNIYPRSAANLVDTVDECVSKCQADPSCNAAVFLSPMHYNVKQQCQLPHDPPSGKACCIFKGHFDGLNSNQHGVVIDLGTTSGACPPDPTPAPPIPTPPPAPTPLAPTPSPQSSFGSIFHFSRCSGEMNDPNGLQWRRLPDGTIQYHMFFQSSGTPANPCADSAPGHAWGHTISPDLVHWHRMNASEVCGSSGGGVALQKGLKLPGQLAGAKSVNIASAPFPKGPPIGLRLFYSDDDNLKVSGLQVQKVQGNVLDPYIAWLALTRCWHFLHLDPIYQVFQQFMPPNTTTDGGDPCVICPSLVPDSVAAGELMRINWQYTLTFHSLIHSLNTHCTLTVLLAIHSQDTSATITCGRIHPTMSLLINGSTSCSQAATNATVGSLGALTRALPNRRRCSSSQRP